MKRLYQQVLLGDVSVIERLRMSRALGTGICESSGRSTAEGIVFGLDALSVVSDSGNACAAGIDYSGTAAGDVGNDARGSDQ